MLVALVVPGGFDRPEVTAGARSIPALQSLVAELSRTHEVHVFCTDFDDHGGTWSLAGATIHDPGRVRSSAGLTLPGARTLERARRLVRALDRVATSRGRRFDVVHAFWVDGNGVAAAAAARARSVPLVASVGGGECAWLPDIAYGNAGSARRRAVTRCVLASAARVTVGSHAARARVPCARVEVVPLGAERAVFEGPVERPAGPPWRLAHVASHLAVKDPRAVLAAVQTLLARGFDVRFDQVGRDLRGGEMQALAAAWGLRERVTFHGEIAPAEVARVLRRAHVHMVASRHESQCVAALEAALAGAVNVGTRVGLLAELAPFAAVTVPHREALADAVAELLADEPRRVAVARAAQGYARAHDASWTAGRFAAMYREVSQLSR